MYKIRLNDGTEYPVKFCAASNGLFTARLITDADFMTIAAAFSDAAKTQIMQYLYDSTVDTFEGYTSLQLINVAENGNYIISLKAVS